MNALSILRASARNNAWSNHRLYAACETLSHEELHAKRTSFFPTIMVTLNHILIVDWYYLDALCREGRGLRVFDRGDEPFADFAPLRVAQRASDRKLIDFVEGLRDERALDADVSIDRPGKLAVDAAGEVLLHIFQHQIHHRGQVHAMLAGTRTKPPQLDEFFLREDLPLRKDDLEAADLPLE
jgi:uncharacterized damage-inducible protein DinB